jgi:histidine triad (HIT) family protein
MATIFSRIVNGEIPCYKIAETDRYLAFLDVRPMAMGHTLCIPKEEVDYLFDMDDEALAGLMLFAKRVARALKAAVPCKKVGVAVIGLEVPHAHVHLMPMNQVSDLSFGKPPLDMDGEAMQALAAAIAAHLD